MFHFDLCTLYESCAVSDDWFCFTPACFCLVLVDWPVTFSCFRFSFSGGKWGGRRGVGEYSGGGWLMDDGLCCDKDRNDCLINDW